MTIRIKDLPDGDSTITPSARIPYEDTNDAANTTKYTTKNALVPQSAWHEPVRVKSTANIPDFSVTPKTQDGVDLVADDRILITEQTNASENGIYKVLSESISTVDLTRADDLDTDEELVSEILVAIEEGTTFAKTIWQLISTGTLTINSSNQVWQEFAKPNVSEYSDVKTYKVGDVIRFFNAENFICTEDITTPESFDYLKWTPENDRLDTGIITTAFTNITPNVSYQGDGVSTTVILTFASDSGYTDTDQIAVLGATNSVFDEPIGVFATVTFVSVDKLTVHYTASSIRPNESGTASIWNYDRVNIGLTRGFVVTNERPSLDDIYTRAQPIEIPAEVGFQFPSINFFEVELFVDHDSDPVGDAFKTRDLALATAKTSYDGMIIGSMQVIPGLVGDYKLLAVGVFPDISYKRTLSHRVETIFQGAKIFPGGVISPGSAGLTLDISSGQTFFPGANFSDDPEYPDNWIFDARTPWEDDGTYLTAFKFGDSLTDSEFNFVGNELDVDNYNPTGVQASVNITSSDFSGNSFSVAAQETTPRGLAWNDDGSKLFVIGNITDTIYEYNLTTNYDITTATFGNSFSVAAQETTPTGLAWNDDGSKLFVIGSTADTVFEYNLTTNYDITTATFGNSFSVAAQELVPQDLAWNNDGSKLFIIGSFTNSIYEYNLTTNYDITTATFGNSFSVAAQETIPTGLAWNDDGSKLFVIGDSTNSIYEYNLTTNYDITTATVGNSFSVAAQETAPTGLAWNDDGSKLFVIGDSTDSIYEYNFTTSYDITTLTGQVVTINVISGGTLYNDGETVNIEGGDDNATATVTVVDGAVVSAVVADAGTGYENSTTKLGHNYDIVPIPVTGPQFQIWRIYSSGNFMVSYYGQTLYSSLDEARSLLDEDIFEEAEISKILAFRGFIITKNNLMQWDLATEGEDWIFIPKPQEYTLDRGNPQKRTGATRQSFQAGIVIQSTGMIDKGEVTQTERSITTVDIVSFVATIVTDDDHNFGVSDRVFFDNTGTALDGTVQLITSIAANDSFEVVILTGNESSIGGTVSNLERIDIDKGSGIIVDHTVADENTAQTVDWEQELGVLVSGITGADTSLGAIFIKKDADGNNTAFSSDTTGPSTTSLTEEVLLGVVKTWKAEDDATVSPFLETDIFSVTNQKIITIAPRIQMDVFHSILERSTGCDVSAVSPVSEWRAQIASGTIIGRGQAFAQSMVDGNTTIIAAQDPMTMLIADTFGFTSSVETDNPNMTVFDNGAGGTTIIPNTSSAIHRWWMTADNRIVFQRGIATYGDQEFRDALYLSENPPTPPGLGSNAFVIASVRIRMNSTNIDESPNTIYQFDLTNPNASGGGGTSAGSDTPWTEPHNAAGNDLTDAGTVQADTFEIINAMDTNPTLTSDSPTQSVNLVKNLGVNNNDPTTILNVDFSASSSAINITDTAMNHTAEFIASGNLAGALNLVQTSADLDEKWFRMQTSAGTTTCFPVQDNALSIGTFVIFDHSTLQATFGGVLGIGDVDNIASLGEIRLETAKSIRAKSTVYDDGIGILFNNNNVELTNFNSMGVLKKFAFSLSGGVLGYTGNTLRLQLNNNTKLTLNTNDIALETAINFDVNNNNILKVGFEDFASISAPGNPAADALRMYAFNDGTKVYPVTQNNNGDIRSVYRSQWMANYDQTSTITTMDPFFFVINGFNDTSSTLPAERIMITTQRIKITKMTFLANFINTPGTLVVTLNVDGVDNADFTFTLMSGDSDIAVTITDEAIINAGSKISIKMVNNTGMAAVVDAMSTTYEIIDD